MKKITREEFIIEAKEAFNGQFPNEVKMATPRGDFMSVYDKSVKDELWNWFLISLENYDLMVESK